MRRPSLLIILSSVLVLHAARAADYFTSRTVEKLFDGHGETEGVTSAPDGQIYFSDITLSRVVHDTKGVTQGGHIWKFDPSSGRTTLFRSPSNKSNGLEFTSDGNLVACEGADFGGRRLSLTDMQTGLCSILTATFDGHPYNAPNDLVIDGKGRIWFTDPKYVGPEALEQPVMAVYRHDPSTGETKRMITDAGKPNGIAISPDQKTLYVGVNDNGSVGVDRLLDENLKPPALRRGFMGILAYDLNADGTAKLRSTLVDYAPQAGPDGMTVDKDGNLVVTSRAEVEPGLRVYSPDGRELARLVMEHAPTNVSFGRGTDGHNLYITADKSLFRVATSTRGWFNH